MKLFTPLMVVFVMAGAVLLAGSPVVAAEAPSCQASASTSCQASCAAKSAVASPAASASACAATAACRCCDKCDGKCTNCCGPNGQCCEQCKCLAGCAKAGCCSATAGAAAAKVGDCSAELAMVLNKLLSQRNEALHAFYLQPVPLTKTCLKLRNQPLCDQRFYIFILRQRAFFKLDLVVGCNAGEIFFLLQTDEEDGGSGGTGTACPACAMDVSLQIFRRFIQDHMR